MIGRLTTLARPYALAAFEYAKEKDALSAWEQLLETATVMVNDARLSRLLSSPLLTSNQLAQLMNELLGVTREKNNFIHLLAEKKRLALLPEITRLFKELVSAEEKILNVTVTTAIPLTETMKSKMNQALTKRFKQKIEITSTIDPAVIGGAVIAIEDWVMDGSVHGQLNRLLNSLSL